MEGRQAVIAAGLGCTSTCAAGDIARALSLSLRAAGRELADVQALCAPAFKREQTSIEDAARELGLRVLFVSDEQLRAQAAFALSHSRRALERAGVPSVAETAALAGASALGGTSARLLGPRSISGSATCALASSEGEP
jgi:cobalt-precorrin 5A hydrolase